MARFNSWSARLVKLMSLLRSGMVVPPTLDCCTGGAIRLVPAKLAANSSTLPDVVKGAAPPEICAVGGVVVWFTRGCAGVGTVPPGGMCDEICADCSWEIVALSPLM